MFFTLLSIFAAYIIFRARFQRKYVEQQNELARVKMIEEERHRIASDMHDDLGTDLTTLVLTTQRMAYRKEASVSELEKVSGNASDLIDKLSQIIWAMNPAYDYLPNLTTYVTRFIAKQCELNHLQFHLEKPEEIPNIRVGASLRRNIFLIFKEALNNAIRHGKPTAVTLKFSFEDNRLIVSLKDNGQGFSPEEKMNSGNGISNLQKRAKLIAADLSIVSSAGNGTEVTIVVKTESAV
jgi:signal transduction histidine kinase